MTRLFEVNVRKLHTAQTSGDGFGEGTSGEQRGEMRGGEERSSDKRRWLQLAATSGNSWSSG